VGAGSAPAGSRSQTPGADAVGETANTVEARACAEELAVKPAAAAHLRETCAAEEI
jgi:hypothetical protein